METKTQYAKQGQSVVRTEFGIVKSENANYKVRLTIVSDSYHFQCSAKVHVWNPEQLAWNLVHSIPHGAMQTPDSLAYYNLYDRESFWEKDRLELWDRANAILG